MRTILAIILWKILLFDIFMVTPFGMWWTLDNLDEGKPCYGILIMFFTAIPFMIIGFYLGIIQ